MNQLISLFAILLIKAQLGLAHSWLDCVDMTNDGCKGYVRGYVGHLDDPMTYRIEHRDNNMPICHPQTQDNPDNYSVKYPRTKARPGQTLQFSYLENGHVTKDRLPPTGKPSPKHYSIHWTGKPYFPSPNRNPAQSAVTDPSQLYKRADLSAANQLGPENNFDDGQCAEDNTTGRSGPLPCTGKLIIPADTKPGVYQFIWFWQFDKDPKAGGEEYTSCFDVEVTDTRGYSLYSPPGSKPVPLRLNSTIANPTVGGRAAKPTSINEPIRNRHNSTNHNGKPNKSKTNTMPLNHNGHEMNKGVDSKAGSRAGNGPSNMMPPMPAMGINSSPSPLLTSMNMAGVASKPNPSYPMGIPSMDIGPKSQPQMETPPMGMRSNSQPLMGMPQMGMFHSSIPSLSSMPPLGMGSNFLHPMDIPPMGMRPSSLPSMEIPSMDMRSNSFHSMEAPPMGMKPNSLPSMEMPPKDMRSNSLHSMEMPPTGMRSNPLPPVEMLSMSHNSSPSLSSIPMPIPNSPSASSTPIRGTLFGPSAQSETAAMSPGMPFNDHDHLPLNFDKPKGFGGPIPLMMGPVIPVEIGGGGGGNVNQQGMGMGMNMNMGPSKADSGTRSQPDITAPIPGQQVRKAPNAPFNDRSNLGTIQDDNNPIQSSLSLDSFNRNSLANMPNRINQNREIENESGEEIEPTPRFNPLSMDPFNRPPMTTMNVPRINDKVTLSSKTMKDLKAIINELKESKNNAEEQKDDLEMQEIKDDKFDFENDVADKLDFTHSSSKGQETEMSSNSMKAMLSKSNQDKGDLKNENLINVPELVTNQLTKKGINVVQNEFDLSPALQKSQPDTNSQSLELTKTIPTENSNKALMGIEPSKNRMSKDISTLTNPNETPLSENQTNERKFSDMFKATSMKADPKILKSDSDLVSTKSNMAPAMDASKNINELVDLQKNSEEVKEIEFTDSTINSDINTPNQIPNIKPVEDRLIPDIKKAEQDNNEGFAKLFSTGPKGMRIIDQSKRIDLSTMDINPSSNLIQSEIGLNSVPAKSLFTEMELEDNKQNLDSNQTPLPQSEPSANDAFGQTMEAENKSFMLKPEQPTPPNMRAEQPKLSNLDSLPLPEPKLGMNPTNIDKDPAGPQISSANSNFPKAQMSKSNTKLNMPIAQDEVSAQSENVEVKKDAKAELKVEKTPEQKDEPITEQKAEVQQVSERETEPIPEAPKQDPIETPASEQTPIQPSNLVPVQPPTPEQAPEQKFETIQTPVQPPVSEQSFSQRADESPQSDSES